MNEDNDRDAALWAWLEMLRAANLFTAVADVAMGFLSSRWPPRANGPGRSSPPTP